MGNGRIPKEYEFVEQMKWKEVFNEDELAICELVGLEGFLKLLNHFRGMPFYFSEERIKKLKREYIQTNPDNLSKEELARKMGFALMTVYRYAANGTPQNLNLFEDNDE